MTSAVEYWNRGVAAVPAMTGAASVMDCSDITDALRGLYWRLPQSLDNVLDVGCGTGRLSKLCNGYLGVDVAIDAIDYCLLNHISAVHIDGPDDLPKGPFGTVCCLSVFTHIGRSDRQAYLRAFRSVAPMLVVDIIPGIEGGGVALWRADPADFMLDLSAIGYAILSIHARTSPDGVTHQYYYCERTE